MTIRSMSSSHSFLTTSFRPLGSFFTIIDATWEWPASFNSDSMSRPEWSSSGLRLSVMLSLAYRMGPSFCDSARRSCRPRETLPGLRMNPSAHNVVTPEQSTRLNDRNRQSLHPDSLCQGTGKLSVDLGRRRLRRTNQDRLAPVN